jgi:hypothetical protein
MQRRLVLGLLLRGAAGCLLRFQLLAWIAGLALALFAPQAGLPLSFLCLLHGCLRLFAHPRQRRCRLCARGGPRIGEVAAVAGVQPMEGTAVQRTGTQQEST